MDAINKIGKMKSLTACIDLLKEEGYTEDLKVTGTEIIALQKGKSYSAEEIKIANFYRFEGPSNPDDNSILYAIETNDGVKGTLVNAYGVYGDDEVGSFILNVENIQKKLVKY